MKAIFVINMARDADRWTAMRAHLVDDLGLSETTDFERFEAVDGKKTFSEEVTAACRAFCTPTMRGCALSHMRLWKLGIERDLDAMLVLEDDARLAPNWRDALDRAMTSLRRETWDLIQLGTIAPRWNNERVDDILVRPKIFAGAHAYVISRRGMRHYVCAIRRAAFHVDIHMGATARRGAVFLVDPPVATQAGMGENSTQFADGARAWPAALNGLLAAVSPKNQGTPPLNYWATVPIAQIPVFGGVAINAWTLVFAILAVVAKKVVPALALLPIALVGLQPAATYSKDMAFCIFLFYGIYFLI